MPGSRGARCRCRRQAAPGCLVRASTLTSVKLRHRVLPLGCCRYMPGVPLGANVVACPDLLQTVK